ncbi:MAG TPA: phage minor capsid protein [Candidatus Gemmiger excrementavium]|uniref:Phage minor capsid protein n=1 Tax=Candidatus Gemmiger excrementavium TaxID=2838608 RepID=A0A9D2JEV5_9FIRM|nr:phage minor capsid protein [Candidatus Gemmiger excrementavium]
MLTPDYLDTLPDALVELWQQVEDDILRDIARRIGKMPDRDTLTDTAAWQAWRYEQMQACHQDVLSLLSRYSGKSKAEIRRMLLDAGLATLASDDALYQAMGFAPSAIDTNQALNNLLNAGYRQTLGSWQNLTATTASTVTGELERVLDRAWLQVSSGAFSYDVAIRRAVDGLATHMNGVTYPSGHKDTLEVAVRRAVLTGTNQTCAKLQLARAEEMGCEYVEVSAHAGARPEHAVWQGKIYHRGGAIVYDGVRYEDFETATGYGTGEGLCGWNCRHNFYPFFPGMSVPNYTADRLAELNARDIEYNGQKYTRYEISQMQRALERRVRRFKRQYLAEDAAGVDATAAAAKLRAARRDLNDFVRATGGRNNSVRTSVSGFGRSQASKATARAKAYEKEQERAILIERLRNAGNLPKTAQIHLTPTAIDVDSLGFDDEHINRQREHGVTSAQAKEWIKNAKISITVWNQHYERYIGEEGAVYVNLEQNEIRTAFSSDEFEGALPTLIEEMRKNGLLR